MFVPNKIIVVVCEGASEKAYLQELNRYFDEEAIPLSFIPKSADGGDYAKVARKYREVRKANHKEEIIIWVDWDIYQRNDRKNLDNYHRKPADIPDFLFSYKNFEDFLSMHFDRAEMDKWMSSCIGRNHFDTPSHSSEYLEDFITFIGKSYTKGEMPIDITFHALENLKRHQKDESILIKCDFAEKLFQSIGSLQTL